MIFITQATYLQDYIVHVTFNDGLSAKIDLRETVEGDTRPIVAALRDLSLFSKVGIEGDTIAWPNGFDLAPEYLRDLISKIRIA